VSIINAGRTDSFEMTGTIALPVILSSISLFSPKTPPKQSQRESLRTVAEDKTRKRAVALRYNPKEDAAPRLVAAGQGHVAERILALAREHGIPIHEDPDLVEILAALDLGELIPEELYGALAEILAFLYRLNRLARPHFAA
jgi:flagellar biosynthesis protein